MHRALRRRVPASVWVLVLCAAWVAESAASDRRLVEAAKQGDEKAVAQLLEQGADVDTPQGDGATALHWAAHRNDARMLDRLIESGADVDAANDLGATPLWVACAGRNTAAVLRLLEAGASPVARLHAGETVLMRCAYTGDAAAVEALLDRGAEIDAIEPSRGQTALMWAAASGQPAVARLLLERGAAVDARTGTVRQLRGTGLRSTTSPAGATEFDAGGFTPLLFAARHGDADSVRVLLDGGADVNEAAADGNSALVIAAMSGHARLAELLLARAADPNAAGAGYTALHAAVLRADAGLVRALLAQGADPNAPLTRSTPVPRWTYQYVLTLREKGATPFLLAVKYLEPEIARLLAAAGADPLATFEDGTTALMAAVGLGMSRATTRRSRLIAPELVAAEWADEERVLESVRAAVEAGAAATIHAATETGNTALHGAARNGFTTVVELLEGHGGDVDAENEDGTTPRDLLETLRAAAPDEEQRPHHADVRVDVLTEAE
ncbi:MAG: ankyrin repeat domain-containing protein [Acidobacteria bacterium]|nr:ankyrin repeat domain-containing protein [Acidobacteriota bacterium]